MKFRGPPTKQNRFSGSVRHYHRSGARPQRSWDQWVNGDAQTSVNVKNWPKIIGITIGLLALALIVVGLMVELR